MKQVAVIVILSGICVAIARIFSYPETRHLLRRPGLVAAHKDPLVLNMLATISSDCNSPTEKPPVQ